MNILKLFLYLFFLFFIFKGRLRKPTLSERFISHRGLHNKEQGVYENTLLAFQAAIDHGYGIELDVQQSLDGFLYVFHDDSMERLFGEDKKFTNLTSREIQSYRLGGERIPLLSDVLSLVDGKVFLIIELKHQKNQAQFVKAVLKELQAYSGEFVIESFDPLILFYLRLLQPSIQRGFLLMPAKSYDSYCFGLLLNSQVLNFFIRPDFIALEKRLYHKSLFRFMSFCLYSYLVIWTIGPYDKIDKEIIIFEGFLPKERFYEEKY